MKRQNNNIMDSIFVHKLKHGLTGIKWSLKMILSGDFGELNEEQKKIIEKNLQENEELILLANSMLIGEKPKKFLNKSLCNVTQIVDSVIKSYQIRVLQKRMTLEFIKPEEKKEATLDGEKIKIVVQNILDNAIRYTPETGKIVISLTKNQNNLELRIHDSGIGIPEGQKEKVFSKFFRATNAQELNNEGSGLGLFITKSIVEAHGGKIWFDSKKDGGSTFYVALPIKKV